VPAPHVPYDPPRVSDEELRARAADFRARMDTRRSVRAFSERAVPREVIEEAIRAASTAPSGAHRQPWTFVAVSDPAVKARVREAAEAEERDFYEHRAPAEWLEALAPLGTDWRKPFLTTAPWLVVLFARRWGAGAGGARAKHYYVQESCGIAAGFFIAALHHAGLATLTHTPSPMGFLREILGRPPNEDAYVLFPVGFPAEGTTVPDLRRRGLDEVAVWVE
jgi:iodotyrosine deiodinase